MVQLTFGVTSRLKLQVFIRDLHKFLVYSSKGVRVALKYKSGRITVVYYKLTYHDVTVFYNCMKEEQNK